jgi:5'-3' exonuclease
MALARAIAGDASDNLPGIKGAGLATVGKRLNFLSDSRTYTIDEVVEYCDKSKAKLKFFTNITESQSLIEHNYKMMQLYAPQMSFQSKMHVKESIENFECEFNKTEIIGMMRADGFGELNWEELRTNLNKISRECLDNTKELF